jgi:formamidase
MGKEGIRYAAKVSLDKPAAEQECLHVQLPNFITIMRLQLL